MTFAPKSPEVAVKRYPAVGIELLRKKVKALTAFNAVDKLHSVARQKRTGQYQYKEKLNATVDGWDEIGTDTSDTEYIQQMDNELEKLGVGSFDPELCDEYTNLERIITRFLKADVPTSAIFALCQLQVDMQSDQPVSYSGVGASQAARAQELDMSDPINQLAFHEIGGLRPLLEIIEHLPIKISIGATQILKEILVHPQVQLEVVKVEGFRVLVKLASSPNSQLRTLATQMFDVVCANQPLAHIARHSGVIDALMVLLLRADDTTPQQLVVSAISAISKLVSQIPKNRAIVQKRGGAEMISALLRSADDDVLIHAATATVHLIEDGAFREELHGSSIIRVMLKHMHSGNAVLRAKCGEAVCKCAERGIDTDLINRSDVMGPLLGLLDTSDPKLLSSATAAIQQSLMSEQNVVRLDELGGIPVLMSKMLEDSATEEVRVKISAAVCNIARLPAGRASLASNNAIRPLIELLKRANVDLLINVTASLAACAINQENRRTIAESEGLQLLWSLLSSHSTKLQANAAAAICPCLDDARNLEMVGESFVGGLQMLVDLLLADDEDVQANVCAAIANLGRFDFTLAVITEQGVLARLAALCTTRNDNLRAHLMRAVVRCCRNPDNRALFSSLGAAVKLIAFLRSLEVDVLKSTLLALFVLSEEPVVCSQLLDNRALPLLISLISSHDNIVQELAAAVVNNVRRSVQQDLR